jgi:hypothetical protein
MGWRRRKSASHRLDQIGWRSAASCSLRLSKASSPSSRALTPARAWRAMLGDEGLPELALSRLARRAECPLCARSGRSPTVRFWFWFTQRNCAANLLSRIKLIWAVQSHLQKYSASRFTQITSISAAIPGPHRGAFRDRHGRRARDAVDAKMLLTNSMCADGEVVWS